MSPTGDQERGFPTQALLNNIICQAVTLEVVEKQHNFAVENAVC